MDRTEFSKKLANTRENLGLGKNEVCRKAGFNFNQLQRLETASHNYKMELAIKYLSALGVCVYIQGKGPGRSVKIDCYDNLLKWIQTKHKESNWTVATLAEMTGFSPTSISNVVNNRQVITVDLFLAICKAYEYNIYIKPE